MALNFNGQTAITDAMYFLIIVMTLTTFTYVFVIPYGQSVDLHLNKEFRQSYASSAVKAILYSSSARLSTEDIRQTSEVDYLFTLIKEDFAEKTAGNAVETIALSDSSKMLLSKNIYHSMNFLAASFDYVFYIRSIEPKEYPFVFFKIAHEEDGNPSAAFFYCEPIADVSQAFNSFLENDVFLKVGDIAKPTPTMIFMPTFSIPNQPIDPSSGPDAILFEVNIAMWNPPTSSIIDDIGINAFKEQYNCTDFEVAET